MKLIILDRDGVINYDSKHYIRHVDDWRPIPGSLDAIARLTDNGYTIAVATNQSGIARGYYNENTLATIHDKMHSLVAAAGGKIDAVFHCPHLPDAGCDCRKPKPGLLHKISDHYGVSLANVPMIGDRMSDIKAAHAAGAMGLMVRTGFVNDDELLQELETYNTKVFEDLNQCVDYVLQLHNTTR